MQKKPLAASFVYILAALMRKGALEYWGLVDSSRRALKPLVRAWWSTQHKHSRVLTSSAAKLPSNFAASGNWLGVRWAGLLHRRLPSCWICLWPYGQGEHHFWEWAFMYWIYCYRKKTLENPIVFKNSLLMKIILTRTPGNLLSHWKPIFKLFLSLLYFISFSKMDFFSPQMRSQFLFRLGQWCSWRGWQKQAASQTITQKTFSQDIYNKYRHQVWGLPFPGSIALPVFSLEGIYYISGLGNVYWDGLIRVENHSTERGFSSPGWTRCSQLGSCWGMSLISPSLQLLSVQC